MKAKIEGSIATLAVADYGSYEEMLDDAADVVMELIHGDDEDPARAPKLLIARIR